MELLIAILLGLILVAMVSSNREAAMGVWKVIRFALFGCALLFGWGLFVAFQAWYVATYETNESNNVMGWIFVAFCPPLFAWASYLEIAPLYRQSKMLAFKWIGIGIGFWVLMALLAVVGRELRNAYEYAGWVMVLVPWLLALLILIKRSLFSENVREVWFGPTELPDPWQVVFTERSEAEAAAREAWEESEKTYSDLTNEQQDQLHKDAHEQRAATEKRLDELLARLEIEKMQRQKNQKYFSVLFCFWAFSFLVFCKLIGIAWDFGFDYAMGLKFVHGRAWVAGTLVVGSLLALFGLVIGVLDDLSKKPNKA